jgi:hypothetical protein
MNNLFVQCPERENKPLPFDLPARLIFLALFLALAVFFAGCCWFFQNVFVPGAPIYALISVVLSAAAFIAFAWLGWRTLAIRRRNF